MYNDNRELAGPFPLPYLSIKFHKTSKDRRQHDIKRRERSYVRDYFEAKKEKEIVFKKKTAYTKRSVRVIPGD